MVNITIELTGTPVIGDWNMYTVASRTVKLPDYTRNELIDAIDDIDGIDDFYQYDEPFELDYDTPGKYYYDGGSMDSLCERLNATSDDALIALADVLPDSPVDFTIDSIIITMTETR